jgi:electron transfer flavoprotein beta subunit
MRVEISGPVVRVKKAKTKEVRRVEPEPTGVPTVTLERIYLPKRKKETRMLTGSSAETAAQLAESCATS